MHLYHYLPHITRDVVRLCRTAGGVHHHHTVAANVLRIQRTGEQLKSTCNQTRGGAENTTRKTKDPQEAFFVYPFL